MHSRCGLVRFSLLTTSWTVVESVCVPYCTVLRQRRGRWRGECKSNVQYQADHVRRYRTRTVHSFFLTNSDKMTKVTFYYDIVSPFVRLHLRNRNDLRTIESETFCLIA